MSKINFKSILKSLLPKGEFFDFESGDDIDLLFEAFADEITLIDCRQNDLINEADPLTTTELITDWERVTGLPLPCFDDLADTIEQRRLDVFSALRATGGQSKAYIIGIAGDAGYIIDIDDDLKVLRAGFRAGDRVRPLGDLHVFIVDATLATTSSEGNPRLECLIETYKPAHTRAIFQYNEVFFRAGSRAGDRLSEIVPN